MDVGRQTQSKIVNNIHCLCVFVYEHVHAHAYVNVCTNKTS